MPTLATPSTTETPSTEQTLPHAAADHESTARPAEGGALVVATPEPAPSTKRSAVAALMAKLEKLWDRDRTPDPSALVPLFSARLTDVAANQLAAQWQKRYQEADARDRRAMLELLVKATADLSPLDEHAGRLFRRLNAQPDGLRFLVALRADLLRWRKQIAGLSALEPVLEGLLSNWFDVGMLELRPLTWDSPASLLEKLIIYEAVHEIQSWDDLRNRLASDRRCYAFFHPAMNDVPLIFVEVAFSAQMADNVQVLLDTQAPAEDLNKVRWAIFYSISNTQPGLRGISFGNFLLKRVVDELLREMPKLKGFATLSPIPGFAGWLERLDGVELQTILREKAAGVSRSDARTRAGTLWANRLRRAARGRDNELLRRSGMKLAAHYLHTLKQNQPIDPVARFHLGNGARLERLNWAADVSAKGLEQSCGLMVNYLYDLSELDNNLASLAQGKPRLGTHVSRLL